MLPHFSGRVIMLKINMHYSHETKGCYVFNADPNSPRAIDTLYIRKGAFVNSSVVPGSITVSVEVR